jgi:hypothetical protein
VAKYKDITKQIIEERIIKFDSVKLETRQGEIIPDVIGVVQGHKIFIEIFVTHRVDDKKKKYIRNEKNISCIEIDLSNLYKNDKNIEQQDLKEKIIHNIENKKWIHHARYKKVIKKVKEECLEKEEKKFEEDKARFERDKTQFEEEKNRLKIEGKYLKKEEKRLKKERKGFLVKNIQKPNLEIENKKNYVKKPPSYRIEIDSTFKGGDFPSKYDDSYKGFRVVGKVINNNKKIPFEAACSVRVYDGKNLLIYFIKSEKNNGNSFYEEINATEREFNSMLSDCISFPLKFTAFTNNNSYW